MTEKFRIYRALWNRPTVNGYVITMFTGTVGVDYLWKILFPYPAFAGDKHGKVGRGHAKGNLERPVELLVVADYAETLFNRLQIHVISQLQ